jgi:hypothetical protein
MDRTAGGYNDKIAKWPKAEKSENSPIFSLVVRQNRLNQQVFSVFLLRRELGRDEPLSSTAGGGGRS